MTNEEWQKWWDTEWAQQRLAIQKWQPPKPPEPEPEMRYRLASASDLDSKLPQSFKAVGEAAATGVGWAIGAVIVGLMGLIAVVPCLAFIGAAIVFLPLPAVIIGLLLWAACAADNACTRSIMREELKRHEKNLRED